MMFDEALVNDVCGGGTCRAETLGGERERERERERPSGEAARGVWALKAEALRELTHAAPQVVCG